MGIHYMIIDNFKGSDLSSYELDHSFVTSYHIQLVENESHKTTLQLTYNFSGWEKGNGAMYIHFNHNTKTYKRPKKIGVFVTSQGYVPWLRMVLLDGNGQKRLVNLTECSLSWNGKKYVDADIPSDWPLPIQLKTIYAVEVDKQYRLSEKINGQLQFSDIQFIYDEVFDWKGPRIEEEKSFPQTIYGNSKQFSMMIIDEQTGVDDDSIWITLNGEVVPFRFFPETGRLEFSLHHLSAGDYWMKIDAADNAQNKMIPPYVREFTVDLSPDVMPPIITNITPVENEVVYTKFPRISFHIVDEQSGVCAKDIIVNVQNVRTKVYYDAETGNGYALPVVPIGIGTQEFSIQARDRAGNETDIIKRSFIIDEIHPIDEQHEIIIVPDTHDAVYLKMILQQISYRNKPLIIHMGDIVDGATEKEFFDVNQVLRENKDLNIFHIPGNHETFFNNLHLYTRYFGSAVYHIEYGELLIVMLNSAYDQSLSVSDSSQFHYVKELLGLFPNKHLIIATHVPFKDPLGTAHEMLEKDVEKMKQIILQHEKDPLHRSITFLFGHLHIVKQWRENGLLHVITGNAAKKGYGKVENGNILGYGRFLLQKNDVKYLYRPIFYAIDIISEGKVMDTVHLSVGKTIDLQVIGYIDILQTKYKVLINDFLYFDGVWYSSNKDVVQITDNGAIKAIHKGEATVSYCINNHRNDIHVIVYE